MKYIDMELEGKETIVISKGGIRLESSACPTLFSFKDIEGNEYYIRFRHGYLSFSRNMEDLCSEKVDGKLSDGLISYEECCIRLLNLGYLINDSLIEDRGKFLVETSCSSKKGWIDGEELNKIFKEREVK